MELEFCVPCPNNLTTVEPGADTEDQCTEGRVCGDGHQRGTKPPCEPCPIGTYRTSGLQGICVPCPNNLTTVKPGATTEDQCSEGKLIQRETQPMIVLHSTTHHC